VAEVDQEEAVVVDLLQPVLEVVVQVVLVDHLNSFLLLLPWYRVLLTQLRLVQADQTLVEAEVVVRFQHQDPQERLDLTGTLEGIPHLTQP
jgi:hypothetical protein